MKTGVAVHPAEHAAPIVALADADLPAALPGADPQVEGAPLLPVARARAFAEPLLRGQPLDTGEDALAHADGVAALLAGVGAAPAMQAAAYLVYAGDFLNKPEEIVTKAFGESYASLVTHTRKLVQIQRAAREALVEEELRQQQTERVRKMLLAFSRDLRVVLLRLASRLQTLRYYAASKKPCPQALATESLHVFAPLANRLGIWQIKWELEDLSFRFLEPETYKAIAKSLDEKRLEREVNVEFARVALVQELRQLGIEAEVQGRPKHLYSIWKKMQGKSLSLERVFDLRALRVIVKDVADCYAVLSHLHEKYQPVAGEFDDYIAKPKPNGYQSLHTVVRGADEKAMEVQIRTRAMHEHAEHGVAAHWAYKEAGTKGYAGVAAAGDFEEQVAQARKAVLRQLLAWERDYVSNEAQGVFDDRIYVFTPQSAVVELSAGSTPVDFAYAVHTDLGHRCRGAKLDGHMVPLDTPLASGQRVEIVAAKPGGAQSAGPSRDWLNPQLGFLKTHRARAKVRQWFNAQQLAETVAQGRATVEKEQRREGASQANLDALARRLGFEKPEELFVAVARDEVNLRQLQGALRELAGLAPEQKAEAPPKRIRARTAAAGGGVLVVGMDRLLTQLAKCCKPVPPDAIRGFVTRGKGVSVHREDCASLKRLAEKAPERLLDAAWGAGAGARADAAYPVDALVIATDRQGLLRDVGDALARERINVTAVRTQNRGDLAHMRFSFAVADVAHLRRAFAAVKEVAGVIRVGRA